MQTSSTATYEDVSANGAFLRQVLDRFIGILGEADTAPIFSCPDSVDELRHTFNTSLYLPKSLLVVRIASRVSEGEQIDPAEGIATRPGHYAEGI